MEKKVKVTNKKTVTKSAPKKETNKKEVTKEVVKETVTKEEFDKKEAIKDLTTKKETNNTPKFVVKDEKEKTVGQRIFDVVFWVTIIGLAFIWLVDFINVKNDKEPKFCISNKVHQFDDGTVTECVGLGYKVFEYNRSSFEHGRQFGPFFIGMKEK